MKRFLALLLATIMCFSVVPASSASESTDANNPSVIVSEKQTITFNSDGEAIATLPTSTVLSSVSSISEVETWNNVTGWINVGTFTMEGNNVTPVKKIGVTGYSVAIYAEYSCSKSVKMTVQILKAYTSSVLLGGEGISSVGKTGTVLTGSAPVTRDQEVQIYFRITDANGNYDDNLPCTVTYWYYLMKDAWR